MNKLLNISTITPMSLWHADYCAKNFRSQSVERNGVFDQFVVVTKEFKNPDLKTLGFLFFAKENFTFAGLGAMMVLKSAL